MLLIGSQTARRVRGWCRWRIPSRNGTSNSKVSHPIDTFYKTLTVVKGLVTDRLERFWTAFLDDYRKWKPRKGVRKTPSNYAAHVAATTDTANFRLISSSLDTHHRIVDNKGNLLAYRLRMHPAHLQTLGDTEGLIPPRSKIQHDRGETIIRNWALWRKYKGYPQYSNDYLDDRVRPDGTGADAWLEANESLINYLNFVLKNLDPKMWAR